jgi:hypothetical protein
MFSLLAAEDAEYVNHYLNIMGATDANGAIDAKRAQEARDDFKRAILIRSIVGNMPGKNNPADTFIINIRSKRKIKVLTTEQLFNAYKDSLHLVEMKNFKDGKVLNKRARTSNIRIANML